MQQVTWTYVLTFTTCTELREHWEIWGRHGRDVTATTKNMTSHGESRTFHLIFNIFVFTWPAETFHWHVMWDFLLPDYQDVLSYYIKKWIYCIYNLINFMPHFLTDQIGQRNSLLTFQQSNLIQPSGYYWISMYG